MWEAFLKSYHNFIFYLVIWQPSLFCHRQSFLETSGHGLDQLVAKEFILTLEECPELLQLLIDVLDPEQGHGLQVRNWVDGMGRSVESQVPQKLLHQSIWNGFKKLFTIECTRSFLSLNVKGPLIVQKYNSLTQIKIGLFLYCLKNGAKSTKGAKCANSENLMPSSTI